MAPGTRKLSKRVLLNNKSPLHTCEAQLGEVEQPGAGPQLLSADLG